MTAVVRQTLLSTQKWLQDPVLPANTLQAAARGYDMGYEDCKMQL